MITLYEHPLSPYAQKVKIALREKGLDFDLRTPDAIGSGQAAGDFLAANPRAEVPAFIDDGVQIFDSTIILEYIEDKWPEPALLPASPEARAQARMIEEVMDTHYEAINWGLGEIHYFGRGEGAAKETLIENAAKQTRSLQRWLERKLEGRDWFNGDAFGWADLAVVPYLNGSAGFGLGPDEGSALAAWLGRVNARETVAKTAQEATASVAGMEQVSQILEQGLFKREYRDHRLEWMIKSGGLQVVIDGLDKDNIRFSHDFE